MHLCIGDENLKVVEEKIYSLLNLFISVQFLFMTHNSVVLVNAITLISLFHSTFYDSDDVAFSLRDCKDLPWLSKYLM